MTDAPAFTIGIEEEYLLVDRETRALSAAPEPLMEACRAELADQVSPEFLQCQIEVGTTVCAGVAEAREDLKRLRACVARQARAHGLAPIAVSCHPFADWKQQTHTDKARYNQLHEALAGVARRMLICGMHVHVGIEAEETRIDVLNQLKYFLPHLLALSTSSPYWQGQDTGLASYRLSVFDNLPRTGPPPRLTGWADYRQSVETLVRLGIIEDGSKIWWDLRPSAQFPTLENRICDVSPRLEDTLTLAALTQAICRMLWRLAQKNQRWRIYDNFLIAENRWRAQRFGPTEGLIDFGAGTIKPMVDLAAELQVLVEEDAAALNSTAEIGRFGDLALLPTSANRQRAAYAEAREGGADHEAALRAVVDHLIDEFEDGL